MEQETRPNETDSRIAFYISIGMGLTFATLTALIVGWIFVTIYMGDPVRAQAALDAAQPYSGSDGINNVILTAERNTPPEGDTRDPWLGEQAWTEGVQAGQEYISDFPEPQNAIVLTDMTTAEIWTYMQQHVSGAMGVSCQYCHDINNFSVDLPQKISARLMMTMVNDINAQFITNLPNWRGYYVQCATCHNTEPIDMPSVSPRFDSSTPPINVELEPLNEQGEPVRQAGTEYTLKEATIYYLYNYQLWLPEYEQNPEEANPRMHRGSLAQVEINAEGEQEPRMQLQTTNNQNTMNQMAWALGQGCNFCHNARNFYAFEGNDEDLNRSQVIELNARNRLKSQQMLLMTTYLAQNWSRYMLPRTQPAMNVPESAFVDYFYSVPPTTDNAQPVQRAAYVDRRYYTQVEGETTFLMPGCYTCHRENNIPKAAIREEGMPLADEWDIETMTFNPDNVTVFPPSLRGQQ